VAAPSTTLTHPNLMWGVFFTAYVIFLLDSPAGKTDAYVVCMV
jgi:hypothetical protein